MLLTFLDTMLSSILTLTQWNRSKSVKDWQQSWRKTSLKMSKLKVSTSDCIRFDKLIIFLGLEDVAAKRKQEDSSLTVSPKINKKGSLISFGGKLRSKAALSKGIYSI